MNVVFMGCVKFSYSTLNCVLKIPEINVVGVITKRASNLNADFCSLEKISTDNGIPCLLVTKNDQIEIERWIQKLKPDVVYCFGWSQLLGQAILNSAPLGVVGYHPAALPKNRGRHPIIWALALGLTKTASTFFFMDQGPDSGDILSQVEVGIDELDTAASLYEKLTQIAILQIEEFSKKLKDKSFTVVPQDHARANYWRKRCEADGEIDWRMSVKTICNLVRALTFPYVGAHCMYKNEKIKVWKVERVLNEKIDYSNIEHGKVVDVVGERLLVKCEDGVIMICQHEFLSVPEKGAYL